MSLSSDLLAQARFLATREPKRPKQATLRRAVSTAYYSLFHLLVEDAALAMFGGTDAAALRAIVRRAFEHGTMKNAARGIAAGEPPEQWKPLLAAPSPELKLVASTLVELQQARHQADYDVGRPVTRDEALDLVERVERATTAWNSIRKQKHGSNSYNLEARVFLAALLVHAQTSRR